MKLSSPYRILQLYGAWVILRAELDDDATPKLKSLQLVGAPHMSEQLAESALRKVMEYEAVKELPRACYACEVAKPADDFHRKGEKRNTECKECHAARQRAYYAQKPKRPSRNKGLKGVRAPSNGA